ncbi:WD40-repeat-containing domain protein [Limtongia smithiae]|uniref:WD40-repeat-containing domain protein n=1 Tax=Limtongia smithiae TaxID=1125753 RepID=UPI0034CEA020
MPVSKPVPPRTVLQFKETVFAAAPHPSKAVVATGLASGHVFAHRYAKDDIEDENYREDSDEDDDDVSAGSVSKSANAATATLLWKTRRHKGSCRALAFDDDGRYLYTVGSDSVIKQASPEDGRVIAKNSVDIKAPPTALAATPTHALVGTESGSLHIFDPRTLKVTATYDNLHDGDYITSITHLAQYQSTMQFITTGSTTVSRVDIRKGVVSTSENQEDELLCSCVAYPSYFEYNPVKPGQRNNGPPPKRVPVTAVVGTSTGVLTFWTRDNWEDQQQRAIISDDSIDCIAEYPGEKIIVSGGDSVVRLMDVKQRKSLGVEFVHGGEDGVVAVCCDSWERVISAGGETVKIWDVPQQLNQSSKKSGTGNTSDSDSDESDKDYEKDDSDSDNEDGDDDDSGDDGEKTKRKRKRKRKSKMKHKIAAAKKAPPRPSFAGLD